MKPSAYAKAGVNIALGNRLKSTLPRLLKAAQRPEVLGKIGGFGGLFALETKKFREPVLVSSIDGVGTKLKVAFALNRHSTVGHDLVNHCVNDIAVLGAEPLFFLDYIGAGKLEPGLFDQIIRGCVAGCAENGCALIGGETAQMPGLYGPGEYDLAGTIIGIVERSEILDGREIRPGDAILGLASSGLHTNGYSLARKVLFERMGLTAKSYLPAVGGRVGDELLKIHRSYGPLLRRLGGWLERGGENKRGKGRRTGAARASSGRKLKGLAHITGGGFIDNIPRILPRDCDAMIWKGSWEVLPIFEVLQEEGNISEAEMFQVFNMGIGMVLIVARESAEAVLDLIGQDQAGGGGHRAWMIGEVTRGHGRTKLASAAARAQKLKTSRARTP